jgi:hypothetical protein
MQEQQFEGVGEEEKEQSPSLLNLFAELHQAMRTAFLNMEENLGNKID